MGAWDWGPWDNDTAHDWFIYSLAEVDKRTEEALESKHPDKVRAAAALLILLGRTFVWPKDDDRRLYLVKLAIEKMRELRDFFVSAGGDEEWGRAIDDEVAVLESRLNKGRENLPLPRSWPGFWK